MIYARQAAADEEASGIGRRQQSFVFSLIYF